jgi:hypothetical protein
MKNYTSRIAFQRSKNTRGYVPPEAVRSAVEGDSLVCSLRQTTSRPLSGRTMDHCRKGSVGSNPICTFNQPKVDRVRAAIALGSGACAGEY